jgi:hypothetical protein
MVIAPRTPYRGRLQTLDYSEDFRPKQSSDPFLLVRPAISRRQALATPPLSMNVTSTSRCLSTMIGTSGVGGAFRPRSTSPHGRVLSLEELASRHRHEKRRTARMFRGALFAVVLAVGAFAAGAAVHRAPHWNWIALGASK